MPGVLELRNADLLVVSRVEGRGTSLRDDGVATGTVQVNRNLGDFADLVLAGFLDGVEEEVLVVELLFEPVLGPDLLEYIFVHAVISGHKMTPFLGVKP